MKRRAPLVVVIALVCAAAPGPAQATSAWLAPAPAISTAGTAATSPDVAMSPQGDVVAVWDQSDGTVYAAIRPAGGAFTAQVPLSDGGQTAWFPRVAIDRNGNALAVWARYTGTVFRAQAAFRPAGGVFGAPQTVSADDANAGFPQVAFDAEGNALMAWVSTPPAGSSTMKSAFRPAGGSFGAVDTISSAGSLSNQFDLAFDRQGNAMVAWPRKASADDTAVDARVEAAVRPANGVFQPSLDVSGYSKAVGAVQLALDPDGNALVTYMYTDTTPVSFDPWPYRIQAAFRPAGGTFQTPENLSATTAPRRAGSLPDVAFDAQGNAVAVWMEGFWTFAAARARGAAFTPGTRISPLVGNTFDPRVAFDAAGTAIAMWTGQSETGLAVRAARRPPGAPAFEAPQDISAEGTQSYSNHHMAFDDAGNGVAVWRRSDGSNERLEVAGYDGAPPLIRQVSIPASGALGTPLPFSADVVDVWSPVTTSWDFGDGASGQGASVSYGYAAAGVFAPRVTATDALGNAAGAGGSVRVSAAPAGSTSLSVSALRVSPSAFRAARSGADTAAVTGTTISYRLSRPAAVRLTVRRERAGRRVGKACLPATPARRGKKRCTRTVPVRGALTQKGKTGANRIRWRGRLTRRALTPGRYVLVARATDETKATSEPRSVRFRIVRR